MRNYFRSYGMPYEQRGSFAVTTKWEGPYAVNNSYEEGGDFHLNLLDSIPGCNLPAKYVCPVSCRSIRTKLRDHDVEPEYSVFKFFRLSRLSFNHPLHIRKSSFISDSFRLNGEFSLFCKPSFLSTFPILHH